ncbi:helix-turn-helix transcriptional regulator [Butyrivibrio sp. INlla16]|uniref:helix-turn-helix domain-containing protein n=1 Tax=Butyrivibrio sp. INlla16 TaxID=1520807 RepID=UPI0008916538|nr:helix-turn-helix transcriptional regulator [Butyrivibrio sp. INlla16]SDB56152.1 DNA-binding transcriptional regulator, XRE family [Butyrivibrio sp. INlla16]
MPIVYDRLWKTMKARGITQYKLMKDNNLSPSLFARLRKNQPVTTTTIENFCKWLDCNVEDILEYRKDPSEEQNE